MSSMFQLFRNITFDLEMLIFCPKKVEDVKSVDDGDVVLDKYSEVINNELEVAISWLSVKD